jgi:hypothetical protein
MLKKIASVDGESLNRHQYQHRLTTLSVSTLCVRVWKTIGAGRAGQTYFWYYWKYGQTTPEKTRTTRNGARPCRPVRLPIKLLRDIDILGR